MMLWSQVGPTLLSKQDGRVMLHSSTSRCLTGTQNYPHNQEHKRYKLLSPSEAEKRSLCVWSNYFPVVRGNQGILIVRADNSGAVLVFFLSWKALEHQSEVMACGSVLQTSASFGQGSAAGQGINLHSWEINAYLYRKIRVQGTAQSLPHAALLFRTSSRLHNNVNPRFIQSDTTCTDGHFLQAEQWKPGLS